MVACPGADEVAAFVRGDLEDARAQAVEEHIDACEPCAQVVVELVRIFQSSATPSGDASAVPSSELTATTEAGEALHTEAPVLPAGASIGRYRVLECIGIGGMGVVYGAYDPELDRRIALKVLRGIGDFDDEERNARLQREAQAMARLSHPNVITVHDVGNVDGLVFLAMEFVRGTTLGRWMRGRRRSWRQVRDVFVAAGNGLAAAHEAGLVHRDFKPENVLIGDEGRVRVTDFGLARFRGESVEDLLHPPDEREGESTGPDGASGTLTRTGALLGTPAYMAPELYKGGTADTATDQFAFCVAMYEALYGQRPFAGRTIAELASNVMHGRVVSPPREISVPLRLRRAVFRGLSHERGDRYPSMRALITALNRRSGTYLRRLALVTIPSVVLAIGLYSSRSDSAADQGFCSSEIDLADAWNPVRRVAVREAFEATGVDYAETSFTGIATQLDRYARRWTELRGEHCESQEAGTAAALASGTHRAQCLLEQRARFVALVDVLSAPDAVVVERANAAVESLPNPAACSDDAALAAGPLLLPDASQRAEVNRLREIKASAVALGSAGKFVRALELVDEVRDGARNIGHAPLVAEALVDVGKLLGQLGRFEEARDHFEEAAWLGVEARHRRAAAQAWVDLMFVYGVELADPDAAHRAERAAAAEIRGLGGDPELEERMLMHSGVIAITEGRYADAMAAFDRLLTGELLAEQPLRRADVIFYVGAVELDTGKLQRAIEHNREYLATYEEQMGPRHPALAKGRFNLGVCLFRMNKFEPALKELTTAAEIEKVAYGASHPAHANTLGAIGAVLAALGRTGEAVDYLQQAIAVLEPRTGGTGAQLGQFHLNLAAAYIDLSRLDDAEAEIDKGRDVTERALGADDPQMAHVGSTAARLALARGDLEAAEEHLRQALRLRQNGLGAAHPEVATTLTELADVLIRAKRPAEAVELLDDLFDSEAGKGARNGDLAYGHEQLARAKWTLGQRATARDHAHQAAELYRTVGLSDDLERVSHWLGEHAL